MEEELDESGQPLDSKALKDKGRQLGASKREGRLLGNPNAKEGRLRCVEIDTKHAFLDSSRHSEAFTGILEGD